MNKTYIKLALFVFASLFFLDFSLAQRPTPKGSPSAMPAAGKSAVKYRFIANYDFIMTNPSSLNNLTTALVWNGTTVVPEKFNNMNGYSVSAGYISGDSVYSLEYGAGSQDLPQTTISPTSQTIQYTLDYQTVYLGYDKIFDNKSYSYELGALLGYAIKFQHHWLLRNGGTTEDVIWQANPVGVKLRANYNYHFSANVRLRAGATYEYLPGTSVKADANHPTVGGIVSGQTLVDGNGQDVKVDISGLRLNVGLVVAF